MDSIGVVFVTRLKPNADIAAVERFLANAKHEHILSNEYIRTLGFYTAQKCPGTLRIARVYDAENDQIRMLLTNQTSWIGDTIAQLPGPIGH